MYESKPMGYETVTNGQHKGAFQVYVEVILGEGHLLFSITTQLEILIRSCDVA